MLSRTSKKLFLWTPNCHCELQDFSFLCSYELSKQLEPPVDSCSPTPWSHRTLTKKLSAWVSLLRSYLSMKTRIILYSQTRVQLTNIEVILSTNKTFLPFLWDFSCCNLSLVKTFVNVVLMQVPIESVLSLLTVSEGSKRVPADQISVSSSGSSASELEDLSSPNSACSIRLQVTGIFMCIEWWLKTLNPIKSHMAMNVFWNCACFSN